MTSPVAKQKRHFSIPGMQKRLRRSDASLLQKIADLGQVTDAAILRMKPEDLTRNRAFAEHQQKMRGAIQRLSRYHRVPALPHRVETNHNRTAFKSMPKEVTGGAK